MAAKSLAERVGLLEEKVGSKTLQAQFREQAELIDVRFAEVNGAISDLRSDVRSLRADFHRLHPKVDSLSVDVGVIREGVAVTLARLGT